MEEHLIVTEILYNDKSVVEVFEYIEIHKMLRLYYLPELNGYGFQFYCIEIIGYTDENCWKDDETDCYIVMQGSAYFDGIRHLYVSRDKDDDYNGYLYYPNLNNLINIIQVLKILEIKYCTDK